MGDRPLGKVFDEYAHFGMITKTSVLLVKSEIRGVQMDDQGWRSSFELFENMRLAGHYLESTG